EPVVVSGQLAEIAHRSREPAQGFRAPDAVNATCDVARGSPGCQACDELAEGVLPLSDHDGGYTPLFEALGREPGRMPAAPDDREPGMGSVDGAGDEKRVPDRGASQHRDANAHSPGVDVPEDGSWWVRFQTTVDDDDVVLRSVERRPDGNQSERHRPEDAAWV